MTDIDTLAARCLKLPDDYWPGDDDEGTTWGRIGVSYNRDSGPRDRTVAECIFERLHDQFPDDVKWQSASHFGYGWVEEILIRVKTDEGEITDAFIAAAEYGEGFDICEFESEISAAEYAATLENIWNENSCNLEIPEHLDQEGFCKAIFSWLFNAGIEAGGDNCTWFSRAEIEKAGLHLGFWNVDEFNEEEFFDALEAEGIALEFRWWCQAVKRRIHEETQGVLFSD